MKKYISLLILITFLSSCTSTKNSTKTGINQKKTINVVVRFIPDNTYFLNTYWNESGNKICYDFFEEQLTANLDNDFLSSTNPVSFYTEKEIQKYNIIADWIIYLKFIDLKISDPKHITTTLSQSQSSYAGNATTYIIPNFSAQTGNEPNPTPYAPIDLVSYTANIPAITSKQYIIHTNAVLGFNIQEGKTSKDLSLNNFKANYLLVKRDSGDDETESDKFPITSSDSSGDSSEKALIVIMENLYNKIYPQIKKNINSVLNNR